MRTLIICLAFIVTACGARTRGLHRDSGPLLPPRPDSRVTFDGPRPDGPRPDGPRPDGPRSDGPPQDFTVDVTSDFTVDFTSDFTVDTTVDMQPDTTVDGGGVGPCAPSAQGNANPPVFIYDPGSMVVCAGSSRDQCGAQQLCGGGWHLCTATEFLARGGANIGYNSAWLASCVREGPGLGDAPNDMVCGTCSGQLTSPTAVRWSCSGAGGTNSSFAWIGISTSGACNRVGLNAPENAARWRNRPAFQLLSEAVCCK